MHYVRMVRQRHPGLRQVPPYVFRGLSIIWLRLRNRGSVYTIHYRDGDFRFRFMPLGRHNGSQGPFLFRERYEPLLQFGAALLPRGGHAIDIGANQGVYACALSRSVGEEGQVIAVEPIPRQLERLRDNLKLNEFSQCKVVPAAVSDHEGEATLHLGDGDTMASIVRGGEGQTLTVDTVTIDDLVAREAMPRVDLIKIDAEGAELRCLRGASATLSAWRPVLCLEANDPEESRDVLSEIEGYDYSFFEFDADGRLARLPGLDHPVANLIALGPDAVSRHVESGLIRAA